MVPFKTTSSNLLSSLNIKSILDINTVTGVFSSRAPSVVLDGNVGIGTNTPSAKLTVNGTVSANSIITGYNISTQNQVQYLSSGIAKVYQYYNNTTNSLDTVFS
jgi:hypothetical protein